MLSGRTISAAPAMPANHNAATASNPASGSGQTGIDLEADGVGPRIHEGHFGVMVAARGDDTEPVPLEKVAGKRKCVPPDHSWVQTARHVGTCMGD